MPEWSDWFENTATGERTRICREPRDDGSMLNELVVAPGSKGPPPHMHPGQDEHFFVQSGVFAGKIGGKKFEARAGEDVFAPSHDPARLVERQRHRRAPLDLHHHARAAA